MGLAGAAFAGTIAMAELERTCNRIAGLARDRRLVFRYVPAVPVLLACQRLEPVRPTSAIVALMLWSMLGSLALAIGMATAAELSDDRRPKEQEETVRLPEPTEKERSPALAGDRRAYGF